MIKRVSVLFLTVIMVVLFAGCSQQPADISRDYNISIITEGGMALKGVEVVVYENVDREDLLWRGETNVAGNVTFTAPLSNDYVAVIGELPVGFISEEYYSVDSVDTRITPEILLEDKDDLSDIKYDLGDIIHDFTVIDYSGTERKLSEILVKKKAVVLNFWYINCGPCKMEFPYLEGAYQQYCDKIEVLALNPIDGTNDGLKSFASQNNLSFPMIVCDNQWESCMELTAYPTTVVIDRYGMIGMIHKGYITETETFNKIFEYFTSDNYIQTTVKNISDIE